MYQKRVSRSAPTLIVMVLDDSGSMAANLPGTAIPKYEWVEKYAEVIFKELLARSTEPVGDQFEVRPRYFVYTTPYGSTPTTWPAGATAESDIDQLIQSYAAGSGGRPGLGLGGNLAGTDAEAAFQAANTYLQTAITQPRFRDSFPPMVFHLTDGESATDAEAVADQIKQLTTSDGNALVVNALMDTATNLSYTGPRDFPGYMTEDEAGPSPYSRKLFRMSSVAPDSIVNNLVRFETFPKFRQGARLYFDVRTQDMLKHILAVVGSQMA